MSIVRAIFGSMLADHRAGNVRGDRAVIAADFGGGVGLEVEAVVMRQSAAEVDEDHRSGPGVGRTNGFRGGFAPEQLRQRKPEHAQTADAQEIAPPESIAAPIDPPIQSNVQHVAPSMIEHKLLRVQ